MGEELTTVQIDVVTRESLRRLANEDLRSMAAELTWLVNQETSRRTVQAVAAADAAANNPLTITQ